MIRILTITIQRYTSSVPDLLVSLLKRAQAQVTELAAPGLVELGLDGREFAVLDAVASTGEPLSQRQIATVLMVDRTTMVTLVDGLERRGFVTRRGHPDDRRKNTIVLTAEGTAALARAADVVAAAESRFLAPLDRDVDLRAALQVLTRS